MLVPLVPAVNESETQLPDANPPAIDFYQSKTSSKFQRAINSRGPRS